MFKIKQQSSKKRLTKKDIGRPMISEVNESPETLKSLLKVNQNALDNYYALQRWENLPENIKLVHALKLDTHSNSQLLHENATTCLSGWDAISASVIDLSDRVPEFYLNSTSGRNPLQTNVTDVKRYFTKSNRMTIGEIVFALELDASNIIGAFHEDVWFNNHAGIQGVSPDSQSTLENKGALSYAIINGVPKANAPIKLPKQTYLHVKPYKEILDKREYGKYSEVIITGREGVHIHPGRGPSKSIRVKEILIFPNGEIEWVNETPILNEYLTTAIVALKRLNPEVPLSILK